MPASVRLNVTVPEDVAEILKEMAGPRGQSSFIADSVRSHAKRMKRRQLLKELEEGYKATANEDLALAREFNSTLMDGLEDDDF